ncbi:MAG TPA: class I SAM-dependent methyltransferase [Azospirillaceae bacterium]|nr:class I SAM-dependent methyltransferase [Azospirillaceae bacterium]
MYLVAGSRHMLLDALPRGGVGAEVGVLTGAFSREILRRAEPSELHLVDNWEMIWPDWRNPPAPWTTADALNFDKYLTQEMPLYPGGDPNLGLELCYAMVEGLGREDNRVRIHRGLSVEMAKQIPDQSLDFAYIDADHTYEACLDDLRAFEPKIKEGGLLMGHDFYEMHASDTPAFGVIGAVEAFCKRRGWTMLALTWEQHATFVLCKSWSEYVAGFVSRLMATEVPIIELPGTVAFNYHTKLLDTAGGRRRLPSFLGNGEIDPWPGT